MHSEPELGSAFEVAGFPEVDADMDIGTEVEAETEAEAECDWDSSGKWGKWDD
jgi:hypothetical protein